MPKPDAVASLDCQSRSRMVLIDWAGDSNDKCKLWPCSATEHADQFSCFGCYCHDSSVKKWEGYSLT